MKLIKSLLEPKLLLTGALLFTCFITYGSLTSTGSLPQLDYAVSDKLIHALSYFLLFLLWFFFWIIKSKEKKYLRKTTLLGVVVFSYGMVIEVLQGTLTAAREADFYDVIANGAGIFCAVLLVILIKKKILKLKSSI
ncbi:VanZ family protein [uncultured Planktosalinus sp.]|uniref:VanZ family protein n=1 Tax=uncultured Planktosalinus sp. TaxID=1810935 RepID=UPI0030D7E556